MKLKKTSSQNHQFFLFSIIIDRIARHIHNERNTSATLQINHSGITIKSLTPSYTTLSYKFPNVQAKRNMIASLGNNFLMYIKPNNPIAITVIIITKGSDISIENEIPVFIAGSKKKVSAHRCLLKNQYFVQRSIITRTPKSVMS